MVGDGVHAAVWADIVEILGLYWAVFGMYRDS